MNRIFKLDILMTYQNKSVRNAGWEKKTFVAGGIWCKIQEEYVGLLFYYLMELE